MKRLFGLAAVSLVLTLTAIAQTPAGGVAPGAWRLATLVPMGTDETTSFIFNVEVTEGKPSATLVSAVNAKAEMVSFDQKEGKVRIVVKSPAEQVFEGVVSKDGKKILGIFGSNQAVVAAYLSPTDPVKVEAQKSDKAEEQLKLQKIDTKDAKKKVKATVDELKAWADVATALAKERGPAAAVEVNTQFAIAFMAKKDGNVASQFALTAEKLLSDKASVDTQVKILQTVCRTLVEAGKDAELKPIAARLEKIEKGLDEAYHATVPPFKAEKFAGRKGQSERVVVMELFTGAQCPPCVAADVAFDVLQKTYGVSELALIQYHLHIPGADPMTNADTEARAKYYKVSSTPSTLFNGVSKAGGGGAMAAAEKKFEAYRKVIDPLLEDTAGCKVTASAKRVNDLIQIQADVAGLEKPGQDIKLRFVVVEEDIRFVGSNKLRFHHQVVRAMPGGVGGVALTEATSSTKKELNVTDLRKQLVRYLDNYNLTGPRCAVPPDRPTVGPGTSARDRPGAG